MTREVGSTVFIAEVNMLNKSVPATVVQCFFFIDGGQTFSLPSSSSTSIMTLSYHGAERVLSVSFTPVHPFLVSPARPILQT
jgi:hypothetical protein